MTTSTQGHLRIAEVLPHQAGDCIVVFFGYFDESGGPDNAAVCVGGWVSTREQWTRFEDEWAEMLHAFGVSALHMNEFAHSRGEYSDWKGDEPRRREFLSKLIGIIGRRARRGFGASVYMSDYNAVAEISDLRERCGEPYVLCGVNCVKMVQSWAEHYGMEMPACFFENGAPGKGDLLNRLSDLGLRTIAFAQKPAYLEFQAADLVAYEIFKMSSDTHKGRVRSLDGLRAPLVALDAVPGSYVVLGKERLLEMCQDR